MTAEDSNPLLPFVCSALEPVNPLTKADVANMAPVLADPLTSRLTPVVPVGSPMITLALPDASNVLIIILAGFPRLTALVSEIQLI